VWLRWCRAGGVTGAGAVWLVRGLVLAAVVVGVTADVGPEPDGAVSETVAAPGCDDARPGCAAATTAATAAVPATAAAADQRVMRATRVNPSFRRWIELMRSACPSGTKAP